MKVASLVSAKFPANGVELTVRNELGQTRSLALSLQAELQMVEALLCGAPARVGTPYQRRPFAAENLKLQMTSAGEIVLEVFLTDKATIQIGLPDPLPKRLQEMLGQDPKTWKGGSRH